MAASEFVCVLQLDVYNQRILEKREQQYQDLLARKKAEKSRDCTMIPPGISTLAQLKRERKRDCRLSYRGVSKASFHFLQVYDFCNILASKSKGKHPLFLSFNSRVLRKVKRYGVSQAYPGTKTLFTINRQLPFPPSQITIFSVIL